MALCSGTLVPEGSSQRWDGPQPSFSEQIVGMWEREEPARACSLEEEAGWVYRGLCPVLRRRGRSRRSLVVAR